MWPTINPTKIARFSSIDAETSSLDFAAPHTAMPVESQTGHLCVGCLDNLGGKAGSWWKLLPRDTSRSRTSSPQPDSFIYMNTDKRYRYTLSIESADHSHDLHILAFDSRDFVLAVMTGCDAKH